LSAKNEHSEKDKDLKSLQKAVDAKRDEISGTVEAIRSTVQEEVRERKQAMKDAFDWKVQYHKFPMISCAGAMAVGAIAGKLVGGKVMDAMHEETLTEYARRKTHEMRDTVHNMSHTTSDPSYWRGRMDSAMSGAGKIAAQEVGKLARDLIVPTIVAAITGKAVHENTKAKYQDKSRPRYNDLRDEIPDGSAGKFSI